MPKLFKMLSLILVATSFALPSYAEQTQFSDKYEIESIKDDDKANFISSLSELVPDYVQICDDIKDMVNNPINKNMFENEYDRYKFNIPKDERFKDYKFPDWIKLSKKQWEQEKKKLVRNENTNGFWEFYHQTKKEFPVYKARFNAGNYKEIDDVYQTFVKSPRYVKDYPYSLVTISKDDFLGASNSYSIFLYKNKTYDIYFYKIKLQNNRTLKHISIYYQYKHKRWGKKGMFLVYDSPILCHLSSTTKNQSTQQ